MTWLSFPLRHIKRKIEVRAYQIWVDSGGGHTTKEVQDRNYRDARTDVLTAYVYSFGKKVAGAIIWFAPLYISLNLLSISQKHDVRQALIKEGWDVLDLREVYIVVGPGYESASLSGGEHLVPVQPTNFHGGGNYLKRVKLISIVDWYVWNRPGEAFYGYDDDARLYILRDHFVNDYSFGKLNGYIDPRVRETEPHPALVTSIGLWKLVAWIERVAAANRAGMLDDATLRTLMRPMAGFCGKDRREFLKTYLTPDALSFLEWYDKKYGIPVKILPLPLVPTTQTVAMHPSTRAVLPHDTSATSQPTTRIIPPTSQPVGLPATMP